MPGEAESLRCRSERSGSTHDDRDETHGIEQGRVEGELLDQFKVYQQLLGRPETQSSELQRLSLTELTSRIADLQQQLRDRE